MIVEGLHKLSVFMMCDLFDHFDLRNGYDTELIRTAISTNHLWALEVAYPGLLNEFEVPEETVFINDKIVFYIGVDSDYFLPHKGALERESIVEIPTQHLKAFIDYDFLFFKPYKKFLDIILYYYMVRKKEDLKKIKFYNFLI